MKKSKWTKQLLFLSLACEEFAWGYFVTVLKIGMLKLQKTLFIRKSILIILPTRGVQGECVNALTVSTDDLVWWHASVSTQLKGYSRHYSTWTNCDTWQIAKHMLLKVVFSPSLPPSFSFFLLWSKFAYVSYGMVLKLLFYLFTFWKSCKKSFHSWYLGSV